MFQISLLFLIRKKIQITIVKEANNANDEKFPRNLSPFSLAIPFPSTEIWTLKMNPYPDMKNTKRKINLEPTLVRYFI